VIKITLTINLLKAGVRVNYFKATIVQLHVNCQ